MSVMSTGLSDHETPRANGRLNRRVYTIDEVAQQLGLSRNSAYTAARENRLPVPVTRVGKRMFVSKAALDRFLDRQAAE